MVVLITLFLDEEKLKILEDVFRRPFVKKNEIDIEKQIYFPDP
jgi:hypothetical protein